MKKQTIKICIIIIFLIFIISIIIIGNSQKNQLKRFCKPDDNLQNIYNLTEDEFLAFSISETIYRRLQYNPVVSLNYDNYTIFKDRITDCIGYSLLLHYCLNENGFDSEVIPVSYPFQNTHLYHAFVVVNIKNKMMPLDAMLGTISRSAVFQGKYLTDYWHYYFEEKEKNDN